MSMSSSTTGEKSASPLIRRHSVITQLGPTAHHHPHHLYHNHHLHRTHFIPAVFVPLLSSVRIEKCHQGYHLESFSVTFFLNGASENLPRQMQSFIDCICMIHLPNEFSNGASNRLLELMQIHTGCICLPSSFPLLPPRH